MKKACITCYKKPIKNGLYRAKLQHFADKQLPKNNKTYHQKLCPKIKISGLKPNKSIFYFGTENRDFTKKIQSRLIAYGKLKNSGVGKVDENGNCIIYLQCPQLYMNDNGKVYSRHFHYLYWDEKNLEWNKDLYTQQILCKIDKDILLKYMKKSILVNPDISSDKPCMNNIISLPYKKNWTESSIFNIIKKKDKLVPIIIYSKESENCIKLYKKLNKLGFYNTVYFTKK